MGARLSREGSWRSTSSVRSNSNSWESPNDFFQTSYGTQESYSYNYAPQQSFGSQQHMHNPSSQDHSTERTQQYSATQNHGGDRRQLDRRYSRIADNYKSLDQVCYIVLKLSVVNWLFVLWTWTMEIRMQNTNMRL